MYLWTKSELNQSLYGPRQRLIERSKYFLDLRISIEGSSNTTLKLCHLSLTFWKAVKEERNQVLFLKAAKRIRHFNICAKLLQQHQSYTILILNSKAEWKQTHPALYWPGSFRSWMKKIIYGIQLHFGLERWSVPRRIMRCMIKNY